MAPACPPLPFNSSLLSRDDNARCNGAVSGGIPFQDRPEGGKLWQLVQRGDAVVASKLDRMFRSASDCLAVVEAFKQRGVSLYLLDLNGGPMAKSEPAVASNCFS